jgi:hypothetical protein
VTQILHKAFLVSQDVVRGADKVKSVRLADCNAVIKVRVVTVINVSAVAGTRVSGINAVKDIVRGEGAFSRLLIR